MTYFSKEIDYKFGHKFTIFFIILNKKVLPLQEINFLLKLKIIR